MQLPGGDTAVECLRPRENSELRRGEGSDASVERFIVP
jgi:hypothetical protein